MELNPKQALSEVTEHIAQLEKERDQLKEERNVLQSHNKVLQDNLVAQRDKTQHYRLLANGASRGEREAHRTASIMRAHMPELDLMSSVDSIRAKGMPLNMISPYGGLKEGQLTMTVVKPRPSPTPTKYHLDARELGKLFTQASLCPEVSKVEQVHDELQYHLKDGVKVIFEGEVDALKYAEAAMPKPTQFKHAKSAVHAYSYGASNAQVAKLFHGFQEQMDEMTKLHIQRMLGGESDFPSTIRKLGRNTHFFYLKNLSFEEAMKYYLDALGISGAGHSPYYQLRTLFRQGGTPKNKLLTHRLESAKKEGMREMRKIADREIEEARHEAHNGGYGEGYNAACAKHKELESLSRAEWRKVQEYVATNKGIKNFTADQLIQFLEQKWNDPVVDVKELARKAAAYDHIVSEAKQLAEAVDNIEDSEGIAMVPAVSVLMKFKLLPEIYKDEKGNKPKDEF